MKKDLPFIFLKKEHYSFFFVGFLAVAFFVGYLIGVKFEKEKYTSFLNSFKTIRENSEKYTFINPLIGNISSPATSVGIYVDIDKKIKQFLKKEEKEGRLYNYSFYFRDLTTGLWFGANEAGDFFPASLFKLPIAIAVYKQGEDSPSFLKTRVVYTKEIAQRNESIASNSQSILVQNKSYSIEELVEIMLVVSDNGAKDLLLTSMNTAYINNLFSLVSLVDPNMLKTYTVSSRKYSLFLRVLYGSSYLNEEHSEYLLKLLSKSNFTQGLKAGVPEGVFVAHKYGVYTIEDTINGRKVQTEQLHDCGVIYHPTRPYVFCFMSKGKKPEELYTIIAQVSKMVYEYQEQEK